MSKISYLAHEVSNGDRWTVEQMLQDELEDLGDYNKALLLKLNDKDGDYDVTFTQAGLSMSQCLALLEVIKTVILKEMGY